MKIDLNLVAIGLALAFFVLYAGVTLRSPIAFGDEGYYITNARLISENNMFPVFDEFYETKIMHPLFTKFPMFFLAESFQYKIGGENIKKLSNF